MNEARRPIFSVVVPVCDGAKFLRAALDSLNAQTLESWECLIVDDGSTDASVEIASRWAAEQTNRVEILSSAGTREGPAAPRNVGMAAASASLIAFLDSDDVWTADKLERQAGFMSSHPEIAAASCRAVVEYDGVDPIPFVEDWRKSLAAIGADRMTNLGLRDFLSGCPFCSSGVVVRRAAILDAGGFNENLRHTSDWLMWACLASRGPLGLLDAELVKLRMHDANNLLHLQERPLGVLHDMLEVHVHIAEWLSADRNIPLREGKTLVERLVKAPDTTSEPQTTASPRDSPEAPITPPVPPSPSPPPSAPPPPSSPEGPESPQEPG